MFNNTEDGAIKDLLNLYLNNFPFFTAPFLAQKEFSNFLNANKSFVDFQNKMNSIFVDSKMRDQFKARYKTALIGQEAKEPMDHAIRGLVSKDPDPSLFIALLNKYPEVKKYLHANIKSLNTFANRYDLYRPKTPEEEKITREINHILKKESISFLQDYIRYNQENLNTLKIIKNNDNARRLLTRLYSLNVLNKIDTTDPIEKIYQAIKDDKLSEIQTIMDSFLNQPKAKKIPDQAKLKNLIAKVAPPDLSEKKSKGPSR